MSSIFCAVLSCYVLCLQHSELSFDCSHTICLGGPNSIALVTLIDDGAAVGDRDHKCVLETLTPSEHITAIQWAWFAKPNASRYCSQQACLWLACQQAFSFFHETCHRPQSHRWLSPGNLCSGIAAGIVLDHWHLDRPPAAAQQ